MTVSLLQNVLLPVGSFVASNPVLIKGERLVLDFAIVVAGGATGVQYFLEFAQADPNAATTNWFREAAEEDQNNGVVQMSKVIRTFKENGGANLAIGTHRITSTFVREHKFARLQAGVAAGGGTAVMNVDELNGLPALSV